MKARYLTLHLLGIAGYTIAGYVAAKLGHPLGLLALVPLGLLAATPHTIMLLELERCEKRLERCKRWEPWQWT